MNKYKTYGKGWHGECVRHSLARRGIKTKQNFNHFKCLTPPKSRSTRPVVSYSKITPSLMTKLQGFLHTKFAKAQDKKPETIGHPAVLKAQRDIEKINNWGKFKLWLKKHEKTILFMGMGGLAGIIGAVAGVPVLMQHVVTGEIIAVGGSQVGTLGITTQTILTGKAIVEEAKVIDKDSNEEVSRLLGQNPVSPEDIKVDTPEQPAYIIKVKHTPIDKAEYSPYDRDYGDLTMMSSDPIKWKDLNSKERSTLNTAIKKVKKLINGKGKKLNLNENNLHIVKRVGNDDTAWGAHQGNLIHIDRDILKNPDKTEGVLLHEAIHRVYDVRDETRELENLHIDYLGLAM